jgi:hypothetical protein
MKFSRGTSAVLAVCVALAVGLLSGAGFAAKSKAKASVKPSGSKVSVPGYMIKGSAVVQGRTFYKTDVPENSLAGIKLGRPAKDILAKWGNPSRTTVGSVRAEVANVPRPGGPAYIPAGGNIGNPLMEDFGPYLNPGGGLPTLPGLTPPGAPSTGAPPGTSGGESGMLTQDEVTWTYDLPNGITLEFIITDGTITQITVGGTGPWSLSKTRVGLQLGDTYKLVLWVCGYPESQKYVGRFLRVGYVDKSRALYTLVNNKVVGITIAMVPTELKQTAQGQ